MPTHTQQFNQRTLRVHLTRNMSLAEFRDYVTNSGVDFDTLTNEERRQWRETFDKRDDHKSCSSPMDTANGGNAASARRLNIPRQRPWRAVDLPCPFLLLHPRPLDELVDVQNAVNAAAENVSQQKDEVDRVFPTVISRMYRGGKTTLIDLIARQLSNSTDLYVITITLSGNFKPLTGESPLQSLVRLIAFTMADVGHTSDFQVDCNQSDLLERLLEINRCGRAVVLLIDELNALGVPLPVEVSRFLTQNFLDKQGRYLIYSSHVQYNVDDVAGPISGFYSPSNRGILTLPLPTCWKASGYARCVGDTVTDLQLTLAVGVPSMVCVMRKPSFKEMSCEERFKRVMERTCLSEGLTDDQYLARHRITLLPLFLHSLISGEHCFSIFEPFSTPTDNGGMRYALIYIPEILLFLDERDGKQIYTSLAAHAGNAEAGKDWELVIMLAIYIRSLAAKYCTQATYGQGPFDIATEGVEDVMVISVPPDVQTLPRAVQFIQDLTIKTKTIYIFQPSYAKFPDFDGFVSYTARKRNEPGADPTATIHGFQCKLSRGYPRHPVPADIARGWFLRGAQTVSAPLRDGWTFLSAEEIENNLLGVGLSILHPMNWGTPPEEDNFD